MERSGDNLLSNRVLRIHWHGCKHITYKNVFTVCICGYKKDSLKDIFILSQMTTFTERSLNYFLCQTKIQHLPIVGSRKFGTTAVKMQLMKCWTTMLSYMELKVSILQVLKVSKFFMTALNNNSRRSM